MPRHTQHCLTCSWQADLIVSAGVHPPCPECGGATERVWSASAAVHGDECDYIDHNLGPKPIRIRSWSEMRRLENALGVRPSVRHVEHPWGPKHNHTVDWSKIACDDYTARNVRELLERAFADPIESADRSSIRVELREPTEAERARIDTPTTVSEQFPAFAAKLREAFRR